MEVNPIAKYKSETYRIFGLLFCSPFGQIFVETTKKLTMNQNKANFVVSEDLIIRFTLAIIGIILICLGGYILSTKKKKPKKDKDHGYF